MNHIRTTMDHRQAHTRLGHRLSPKGALVVPYENDGCRWRPKDKCQCQGTKLRVYIKALDCMNNSSLLMPWKTLGHEIKGLDSMNILVLWMIWKTLGCELRALNTMNNVRLGLTWKTLGHELKALDAMNNSRLWMTWATLGLEFMTLDAITTLGCGWHERL